MRILTAEDDEDALAKFVRQGLEAENYAVDVVADGEQARRIATETDYDVVILDLNLPNLDGVGILRHLRLRKPTLPVLILTQRTRVEDRVQCLDTGAGDYLAKPLSFSELSAQIRALVRRSHLPSESVLTAADLKLERGDFRRYLLDKPVVYYQENCFSGAKRDLVQSVIPCPDSFFWGCPYTVKASGVCLTVLV